MKLIIKIGTNVLLSSNNCLNLDLMQKLVQEIGQLYHQNHQIIVITSGAVAAGKEIISSDLLPRTCLAALGQAKLIKYYYDFFNEQNAKIAQILLSPSSFKNRARYDHLKNTLQELLDCHIIPIINENDATVLFTRRSESVGGEDTFGDNDSLAAMIAVISEAQKLIFLTNLDGFYCADPSLDRRAEIVREVKNVDLEIQKMCSQKTSSLGRGGMSSKLKGAKLATTCGIEVYIINGLKPDNISKLLIEDKQIGTKFIAQKSDLSERKKWLLVGAVSQSKIVVDHGARAALENHNSLLAVGVRKVKGDFDKGNFVNIADNQGEIFALGLVNYSSQELSALNKLKDKAEIKQRFKQEIVHIDNLALLK